MSSRNDLLQLRVNQEEIELVNKIRDQMKTDSTAETIRQMIRDEILLMKICKQKTNGNSEMSPVLLDVLDSAVQRRRWNIVTGVLKLNTDGAIEIINQANQNFRMLNQILSGIIFQQNKIGTNLNQLAHDANQAAQVDPSNRDTWNWIINQLSTMKNEMSQLNIMVDKINKTADKIAHQKLGA